MCDTKSMNEMTPLTWRGNGIQSQIAGGIFFESAVWLWKYHGRSGLAELDGDLSLGEYGTGVVGEVTSNSFSAVVSLPSVPCVVPTVSVEPAETRETTPSLSAPDDDERERRR